MIVAVPLYLQIVGIERYGLYSIAVAFLGYFGLFDLGIGRATARKVAALRREASKSVVVVIWSGLSVTAVFSIVGGVLIALVAGVYFGRGMALGEGLRAEAAEASWILGLLLPLTLLTGMFAGTLQGLESFLRLNVVNVFGTVMAQMFPLLACVALTPSLSSMLIGLVVARLLAVVALAAMLRGSLQGERLWAAPRRMQVIELMRFGGWVSISAVIGPILSTVDRVAIGTLNGPAAVAVFSIPFGLVRRVELLPMALSSAIFPRLVRERDAEQRARLAATALAILSAAVTPMIVLGGLILEPFLAIWLDPGLAEAATPVGAILLAAFWAKSHAIVPFELLTARGRPDLVAKLHLAEAAPYIAVLGAAIYFFGIAGAAAAWTLRALVDSALLFAIARRHLGLAARPPVIAPAALISATVAVTLMLSMDSALRWTLAAALGAASLAWAWRTAPEELRRRVAIL